MSSREDSLRVLREALRFSPDNVPLRQHLGDTLLALGRAAESEKEYRHALSLANDNSALKLGLANAFYQQGKYSEAGVVVEDLIRNPSPPPRAHLLNARLLLRTGDAPAAVRQYRQALERDESLADAHLADHSCSRRMARPSAAAFCCTGRPAAARRTWLTPCSACAGSASSTPRGQ